MAQGVRYTPPLCLSLCRIPALSDKVEDKVKDKDGSRAFQSEMDKAVAQTSKSAVSQVS